MTAVISKTTLSGIRAAKKPQTASLTRAQLKALARQRRKHVKNS